MAMAQASTRMVTTRAQARPAAGRQARAQAAPAINFGAESASFHTWNPHNNSALISFPLTDYPKAMQVLHFCWRLGKSK